MKNLCLNTLISDAFSFIIFYLLEYTDEYYI
jgi:hypothetical protein